ncbi:hypothetical protein ACS0TY_024586 [Phlomoides rotata]
MNSSVNVNGLVKHAAEVYTLTIFNIFENEFLKMSTAVARNLRNAACCVAIAFGYYKLIV